MDKIIVATDGSALKNPNGPGGWAWVIDKDRWDSGSTPQASNQAMEMFAIYQALKSIPPHIPLVIQTDSKFCVNLIGESGRSGWMWGWKRKGWRKADGKFPANFQLVRALAALIEKRTGSLELQWVRGHDGHELNTIADKLCTRASAAQSTGKTTPRGPGWSSTTEARRAPATKRASTRSSAPSRTAGRTKRVVRSASRVRAPERFITSFDEGPDAMPISPLAQSRGKPVTCHSCNGPINPLTEECRCSA